MLGLACRLRTSATRAISANIGYKPKSLKSFIGGGSVKYFSQSTRDTSSIDISAEQDEYTNEPVYSDDKDSFAVHSSEFVNPKIVRVPYLTPSMKEDIYKLYTTEVSNNKDSASINNNTIIRSIAKKYNASYDRIQAVIYLAENKIKVMKEHKVDVIPDDHNIIYSRIKELSDAIEMEKQKEAESKAKKSKKEKNVVAAADTPSSAGGDGTTPEAAPPKLLTIPELQAELSKEYTIPVEEIKVIYDRLLKHHIWLDNELAFHEYYEQLMKDYTTAGADTTFRETSFERKSKKNENYYPSLFDDEDEEEAKRKLIKRVQDETRAVAVTDLFTYIDKDVTKLSVSVGNNNINYDERTKVNRWKYGFKDLSEGKKDDRTVIYTRSGKLRFANALEESNRSWVADQPSLVDLTLNKSSIEKYDDFDNDKVKVQEFIKSKAIRNSLILNEKNAKTAKK